MSSSQPPAEVDVVYAVLGIELALLTSALCAMYFFEIGLPPLRADPKTAVQCMIALAPSVLGLRWLARSTWPPAQRLMRVSQEEVAPRFVHCTPRQMILISISAGVGEELFFRGALQTGLLAPLGLVGAVIVTNLLFGAMHPTSKAYILIAALMGTWWSVALAVSGTLTVPIIAHAGHDIIALFMIRRLWSP